MQIFRYLRYPYSEEVVRVQWLSSDRLVVTVARCDDLWVQRHEAMGRQIAYQSDEGGTTHACDE
ncbi:MAG: hypothetical protein U0821_00800 [Chloroflexota bacterium]